jgi:hypothetical protein
MRSIGLSRFQGGRIFFSEGFGQVSLAASYRRNQFDRTETFGLSFDKSLGNDKVQNPNVK